MLSSGCAHPPAMDPLPLEAPPAFSRSGAARMPVWWWTAFEDEALNALVQQALAANFNLASAWQRLRAAQAVVARETASLFPNLELFGEGEVSQPEPPEYERLRLGLVSSYEVDLWGRIRANVEAERFRVEATAADYQTAALSLAAEVARIWYQLSAAALQLALIEAQIETNATVLALIEARFGIGQTRSVDILRQRQLLEATREQKLASEARLGVLSHRLAVLLGKPPREAPAVRTDPLPGLPPLPETGLPSALVRRRPDVQNAFSLLAAADRDLAAAISSRYPRLTLTASLATRDSDAAALFRDWIGALAASLLTPVWEGGRLSAEVDRQRALKKQRLYAYGQTILKAFEEVENALIQEQKQRARVDSLQRQVRLAEDSFERLRFEYFNGVGNYIDVLTALTSEQRLRRDLLEARRLLLEYRIALYRALAGGFEIESGRHGN